MWCGVPVFMVERVCTFQLEAAQASAAVQIVMLLAPWSSGVSDGVQLLRRKSGRAIMFN